MRIVTRPDFDGVVCAVLLFEAQAVEGPVKWVEPGEVQRGIADIRKGDILANLPYDGRCSLWFDHHHSNRIEQPFEGAFRMAPSAARIVFEYYKGSHVKDYSDLVEAADKVDSAGFSRDEVLHPEKYPYIILSMTIDSRGDSEELYWNRLVDLLRKSEIHTVLGDPEVRARCNRTVAENAQFVDVLKGHTSMRGGVSITDFRGLPERPYGSRFLVYSLFPESYVNVCLLNDGLRKRRVLVKVGHSIFNRNCHTNVGELLSSFDGGGHRGAGSCSVSQESADSDIETIVGVLMENRS